MAWSYVVKFDTRRFFYFTFLLSLVFWTAVMTYITHLNINMLNDAPSIENLDAEALLSLQEINSSTENNQITWLASTWASLLLPSLSSYFSPLSTNVLSQIAYAQAGEENKTAGESVATEPNAQIATQDAIRNLPTGTDDPSSEDQSSNKSSKQVVIENRELPDDDCLFNPSLEKCAPVGERCPAGFLMNEDQNCFPNKPCPSGFTKIDEDETGTCYPIGPEKEDEEIIATTASKSAEEDKKKEEEVIDKGEARTPLEVIRQIVRENQSNHLLHAESESCPPISDSLPLAGEMKPNGIKIIVFSYPCEFDYGNITLKIPRNLTLVAGHFDDKAREATMIPMEQVQLDASNGSSSSSPLVSSFVYRAHVRGQMTIPAQLSNNGSSFVSDVNTLILWNSNVNQSIVFGPDNSILPSIFLRK